MSQQKNEENKSESVFFTVGEPIPTPYAKLTHCIFVKYPNECPLLAIIGDLENYMRKNSDQSKEMAERLNCFWDIINDHKDEEINPKLIDDLMDLIQEIQESHERRNETIKKIKNMIHESIIETINSDRLPTYKEFLPKYKNFF